MPKLYVNEELKEQELPLFSKDDELLKRGVMIIEEFAEMQKNRFEAAGRLFGIQGGGSSDSSSDLEIYDFDSDFMVGEDYDNY